MLAQRMALLALLLPASIAGAQSNLGELLDAGAQKLSTEEFKRELAGRPLTGLAPSGRAMLQIVYLDSGLISGVAANTMYGGAFAPNVQYEVHGSWNIEGTERVCATMTLAHVVLPARCQYWYRYDNRYFVSDSDTDRSARILARTRKE